MEPAGRSFTERLDLQHLRRPRLRDVSLRQAIQINDAGKIVGSYRDATSGQPHGFLLSGGVYTTIDDPNAATGFEPRPGDGSMGHQRLPDRSWGDIRCRLGPHGFLLSGGVFTTIDVPNAAIGSADGTGASAINASGQIVGYYDTFGAPGPGVHGFLLSGGVYTTIDDPNGYYSTFPSGSTTLGRSLGTMSMPAVVSHGFLYSGGVYTTIDDPVGATAPLANGTEAFGINNAGQIVGFYHDASGVSHGFLYSGGVYTTIDYPGAKGTEHRRDQQRRTDRRELSRRLKSHPWLCRQQLPRFR